MTGASAFFKIISMKHAVAANIAYLYLGMIFPGDPLEDASVSVWILFFIVSSIDLYIFVNAFSF